MCAAKLVLSGNHEELVHAVHAVHFMLIVDLLSARAFSCTHVAIMGLKKNIPHPLGIDTFPGAKSSSRDRIAYMCRVQEQEKQEEQEEALVTGAPRAYAGVSVLNRGQ